MRRLLKLLHTVSAIGFAGGLAAYMLVLTNAPEVGATAQYLALRQALAAIANTLVIPSMVIGITSGLLAMAVHFPFHEARWVWIKGLSGVLLFEASLMSIDAPADQAAAAAQKALNGEIDSTQLAALVHDEWVAMWTLLGLAGLNIVLGVWRPRLRQLPEREADEQDSSDHPEHTEP